MLNGKTKWRVVSAVVCGVSVLCVMVDTKHISEMSSVNPGLTVEKLACQSNTRRSDTSLMMTILKSVLAVLFIAADAAADDDDDDDDGDDVVVGGGGGDGSGSADDNDVAVHHREGRSDR